MARYEKRHNGDLNPRRKFESSYSAKLVRTFIFMHRTLNIPLKLMKRYRKDKQMWELFIFAVCIKCIKGSSGIYPDVMSVRRMMKCSHNKAKRMIERAKHCKELFLLQREKELSRGSHVHSWQTGEELLSFTSQGICGLLRILL